MQKLRVSIVTVGCRANQSDSAWLARRLDPNFVTVVKPDEQADVTIINSCAVTAAAERDVRRAIHRARRLNSDQGRIILTGCMVTASPKSVRELEPLWHVIPSTERKRIPQLLQELDTSTIFTIPPPLRKTRPSLRVQDGCRMKCSYCAVPAGRGHLQSMESKEILRSLEILAGEGAREVVICGINLGAWGKDLRPKQDFAALLQLLETQMFIERIRLSSLEPWSVTQRVVETFRGSSRIAPHFHLPLQSGDDFILARMKRPYRTERFRRIVDALLAVRPEMAIGTDVIAGFPGETETSFQRTLTYLEGLPLSYIHAFSFSPRHGTQAAALDGVVERETIRKRVAKLRDLAEIKHQIFVQQMLGIPVRSLVESRTKDGPLRGVSGRFVTVYHEGPDDHIGQIVTLIPRAVTKNGDLWGEIASRRMSHSTV